MPDPYQALATDYHWLYDDVALRVGTATPGVRAALFGLTPGARILDAACGIGVDVIALHRRGFDVVGADASGAMIDVARDRAADAGIEARFIRTRWCDLPRHFPSRSFDAVLCTGNALSHSRRPSDLSANLKALGDVLAPGGVLIADAQHWEQIHDPGSPTITDPDVVERDGVRCKSHYGWQIPEDFTSPFTLDLTMVFSDGSQDWERSHGFVFNAFTRGQLREAARSVGLDVLTLDAREESDRYTFVARTATD